MHHSSTISKPTARKLRVAAVQMVFDRSIEKNLEQLERAVAEANRNGADAVLFPECAITGYACDFGSLDPNEIHTAVRVVAAAAARYQVNLLFGSPVLGRPRSYNCLLVVNRWGRLSHAYAKCQLTEGDRRWFTPGNSLSLFAVDRVPATAIICHERRYPELVRLPVMAGAQVVFHPNAGLDALAVSRTKRGGRDGIPVRAFENAVFYVFANSVGPQGGGKWSAGDSKIVAPDGTILQLADNRNEAVLVADLELSQATRKYPLDSLKHPRFLARHWRHLLPEMRRRVRATDDLFRRWFDPLPA